MVNRLLCALVVLGLSSTLPGGVGELSYVAVESKDAIMGSRPSFANPNQFKNPPADSGTVSPDATVATLRVGPMTIAVAVDSKAADAKAPDVVRVDFTGEGKFKDAVAVALTMDRTDAGTSALAGSFGPAKAEFQRDGKTIPVTLWGSYQKQGNQRFMLIGLTVAAQGQCKFGDKTYWVRVIDGTSDLSLGDAAKPVQREGKVVGLSPGDALWIDTSDGSFTKDVRKSLCGQMVFVDGAWYDVKVAPDTLKVEATPAEAKTGQVKIDHDSWEATFIGKTHVVGLFGGKEVLAVPADQYTIVDYREFSAPDDRGRRAQLLRSGRKEMAENKAKVIDVPADQTTLIVIGSPLSAAVLAEQKGKAVSLNLQLEDASGTAVDYVMTAEGQRPPEPKVEILGADGKEVYKCTLGYG